ncbi:MAG: HDOD domain-containing protein [Gammaproteobacteria bacterium]|nr:HDOD domain-containing protein [Gammaproteobacteria bacterium]MDP2346549.1 HDOD domain-containing protein [Gammaproteobacteria bacterium]
MSVIVRSQKNSKVERLVRIVLLQDFKGKLQVIVRDNHLLDLKLLNSLTDRELVPVHQTEIFELTRTRKLKQLDIAPGFFLLPTILEENVASQPDCCFEIFETDGVEIQQLALDDLRAALHAADYRVSVVKCSVPDSLLKKRAPDNGSDLDEIFTSIKNFTTLRIKQRLEETLEIPPLPQTARRIIKLRANPDAAVGELAEIVESDASLAAQVVSWASSPYYAAPGKIRSVQDAIVRILGFDLVSNLAVGMALGSTISLPKDSVWGITPYWVQSVYCSTVVESVVRQIPANKRPSQGLACLAGLLHNFGYLVLAHTFPPHFSTICRHVEANPAISHVAIDHHLLGVTREQISAWLMQLWNMPPEVSTALRFQHDADYNGEHCIYPHLIFIVMRLLRQHGIGDAPPEEIPLELYQRHDLDPDKVREAVQRVVSSGEDIKQIADNFHA